MISPSDINKNAYDVLVAKMKESKKGITKTPLAIHKNILIGGTLVLASALALHHVFPPNLYPSAMLGMTKLGMFLGGAMGMIGSVLIGEGVKSEVNNNIEHSIRTLIETRDLKKEVFYTPEGTLRDLEDSSHFKYTKVDVWHSNGSLLNHYEGYQSLGDLIDARLVSVKEEASEYIKNNKERAFTNAV